MQETARFGQEEVEFSNPKAGPPMPAETSTHSERLSIGGKTIPVAIEFQDETQPQQRTTTLVVLEHTTSLEVTMNHAACKASSGLARASNLLWRTVFVSATLVALFFLASCANKQASA